MADAVRKLGAAETPLYREAPNNVEAEQALLGALLVNNDAFYRVSDFLKPSHFHEPIHRKIYEVAGELVREARIDHGMPAIFHHDDLVVIALQEGQRLRQDAGGFVDRNFGHLASVPAGRKAAL